MNKTVIRKWLAMALLAIASGAGVAAETVRLYAGTARADITPPVGQPMGGFLSRLAVNGGASQGIHDPLYARVLALRQGDESVAIVSLDLLFFSSAHVIAEAKRQWGVSHVVLASSHTHSGPIPTTGGMPQWSNLNVNPTSVLDFAAFSLDPWYAATEAKIIAAIGEALLNLFPAKVAAGKGSLVSNYMAHNRRHINANGTVTMWWTNPQRLPTEPLDPRVGVIRIDDDTGAPRALLVNYACHPVILGDQNLQISAEFPGAMAAHIEETLGPSCMPMFLQGAEGDIDPYNITSGTNGFYQVQQAGRDLADEALRVAGTLIPRTEASLGVRQRELAIPERTGSANSLVDTLTLMVNADTALVAIPGEAFISHQIDLAARSPLANTFLLGLGYCGRGIPLALYLPTVQAAAQGGYGASEASFLVPSAGKWLIDGAVRSIHELRGDTAWGSVYHVAPPSAGTTSEPPYASWATAATNILDAVALARDGDTVLVSNGVYALRGTISITNDVALRSYNRGALDRDGTILDGNYPISTGRCLYLNHPYAIAEGFTITNGYVVGNGGGVSISAGTLRDCVIIGNTATNGSGGGVYATGMNSLITNCDIIANAAIYQSGSTAGGGGVKLAAYASLWNSRVMFNRSPLYWSAGGGVHSTGGLIVNCSIVSNTALDGYSGGGVWVDGSIGTTLRNCLITGNDDGRNNYAAGVGTHGGSAVIENCTIVANLGPGIASSWQGATYRVLNTISYFNSGADMSIQAGALIASNCCAASMNAVTGGSGNITNNPLFVDFARGNFRLQSNSPCINTGTKGNWMTNACDLDGAARIAQGIVDRGAYEYLPHGVPEWWLAQHGLTNFVADAMGDPDSDGMLTWQEWVAGCNPSDSNSLFRFLSIDGEPGQGIVLRWPSISNRFYNLYRSTNLVAGTNEFILLPGAGNMPATPWENSYTDSVHGAGPYFYKVDVHE